MILQHLNLDTLTISMIQDGGQKKVKMTKIFKKGFPLMCTEHNVIRYTDYHQECVSIYDEYTPYFLGKLFSENIEYKNDNTVLWTHLKLKKRNAYSHMLTRCLTMNDDELVIINKSTTSIGKHIDPLEWLKRYAQHPFRLDFHVCRTFEHMYSDPAKITSERYNRYATISRAWLAVFMLSMSGDEDYLAFKLKYHGQLNEEKWGKYLAGR